MRQRFLLVVLTCCAGLYPDLATLGAAQEETTADSPEIGFIDIVDVEIANIDVWVTDKQGKPISGLSAEDFIVRRDGRPVEIQNFYAVDDDRPEPLDPADPAPQASQPIEPTPKRADPLAPTTDVEIAPEHRLWLIIYIDNYNIDPIERNRILPDLWRFLARTLRPEDQAMLVNYNRTLEVVQPFTNSVPQIQRAVEEMVDESGYAQLRQRFRFDTLKRIDRAGSTGQALTYAKQYAEEQMNGVGYTLDALKRLIDTLGGLPGRKALLHVSSGVPMTAGEEMFHAVAEKFGQAEAYAEIPRHDTSRQFQEVSRYANSHRVAFYTIDAGGFKAFEFGGAEYGGFVSPRLRQTLDTVVPENLQAPLRLMALETGGQAILNQNNILPALERAALGFRSFYSLGIPSLASQTGRYHSVKVELREPRKGVTLRHRPGYRSKTLDTRVRESLSSALLYSHQSNPLGIDLTWGNAQRQSDGTYILPIRVEIPLNDIVILPRQPGNNELSLRLFYGAVGEDSGASEIDSSPLGLRLADEHVAAAREESLIHSHQLQLGAGRKKIGVAVVDLFGRESSVVTYFVQVGPAERLPGDDGP